MRGNVKTRTVIGVCTGLAVLVLAVYLQTAGYQFVFDDEDYITANPHVAGGLTVSNVLWAFTSSHSSNWHPITWLSHMVDVQLYGLNPGGHHLTSVILHAIASVVLLLLLHRLTGALWRSGFVAALFALHPTHVESVAWVAERKDVLSALFGFLTLLLYAEYTAKRTRGRYLATLGCFIAGLMSKPMLVTLPLLMLLLDVWPLGLYREGNPAEAPASGTAGLLALVREKLPFFVCSLCLGYHHHQCPAQRGGDQEP